MKVSVIIPTLNAEKWIDRQLTVLLSQTVEAEILVIDSGSKDDTLRIARRYEDRVRLLEIPNEEYDHGGTRDRALRQCGGDFVLFLTQDAVPTDERCIEKLLSPFADERIAAAFARQIAWPDAPEYEKLNRQFNYPETPCVWSEEDIRQYGVKAFFFSNCCSAYRRTAYEAVGGFDAPIATNEDMLIAAKFLHAGWCLAYQPEAAVWHSHADSLLCDYRRNVRIGGVLWRYRDRLTGSDTAGEGLRLVRFVSGNLLREKKLAQLPVFIAHAAARFTGYQTGKRRAKREDKSE